MITSGRNLSKRENISVPLMYEWYEEYYLGGAHGIAGILYLILQVSLLFQVASLVIKRGEELASEEQTEAPLMYEWHNKKYLGGAHGIAGILFILLQVLFSSFKLKIVIIKHETQALFAEFCLQVSLHLFLINAFKFVWLFYFHFSILF